MSLPLPWVDKIFEKLTLVYGQAFLARWRDLDLDAVKHDWAHELAGFEAHPAAIAHALQSLPPDKPPTVLQFRDLARRAPLSELPRLESPPADAQRVAAELAKLATARTTAAPQSADPRAWARRICERHQRGERLNRTVLRMAQQAIGAAP
jgi:hypothetical protein